MLRTMQPSVVLDPFELTNYEAPIFLTLAESKDLLNYKTRRRIYISLSQNGNAVRRKIINSPCIFLSFLYRVLVDNENYSLRRKVTPSVRGPFSSPHRSIRRLASRFKFLFRTPHEEIPLVPARFAIPIVLY